MHWDCTACKNLEQESNFHRCTLHEKTVFNPNMAGCSEGSRNYYPAMSPIPAKHQPFAETYRSYADSGFNRSVTYLH